MKVLMDIPDEHVTTIRNVVEAIKGTMEILEDNTTMMTPGDYLKSLRLSRGMSQAALAKKLDCSGGTISRYECNYDPVPERLHSKLVRIFRANPALFIRIDQYYENRAAATEIPPIIKESIQRPERAEVALTEPARVH